MTTAKSRCGVRDDGLLENEVGDDIVGVGIVGIFPGTYIHCEGDIIQDG
jgi:hypothetical protein